MEHRILAVALLVLIAGCPSGATDGTTGQPNGTTVSTPPVTATPTPTAASTKTPIVTSTGTPRSESREHALTESFIVGAGASRLRYVVTDVNRTDQIGGEFGVSANEEFVVVSLEATNVAADPTRLTSDVFALVDSENRTYPTDSQAMVFTDKGLTLRSLGPDATISGVLVFDIPSDRQGLRLQIEPGNATSTADAHYVEIS